MTTNITAATASNEASAIAVVALAFAADPVARWTWPDPNAFLQHFPRFVGAFGGEAFRHASAYCSAGCAGAALWLPPGVEPEEDALMQLLEDTAPEHSRGDAFALLEQMGRYHPTEPHWYLPLIGVDPIQQGRGHGAALMQHALLRCDHEHASAYLESTNPRNLPLYERHGFEVIGTCQAGASPPVFPMLRKAR